jgi:adhesin transport system membrane fusion protein
MKFRISTTFLMLGGLALFMTWAALFEIDQTVRAQGQIMPMARTQVIQAADGGVLSRILVQEGQSVQAGEPLAELERERSTAAYEEKRARDASMALALIRAQAEASGQAPQFGDKYREFGAFVAAQQALYEQRKRGVAEETAALQDSLGMAREELTMSENLFATGDTSRVEVMRARRQVSELQGRLNAVQNKYRQDARQEAAKLGEELSSSRYKLDEQKSILAHTTITAPVAGIVKYMKVTTIGGVLRAGDELMQISPTSGDMIVEVKVNPIDIGQLHGGLPAFVKLDAFDYSIYGNLQGKLSYISSDTLTEQGANGQAATYYRAHIKLDPHQVNSKLAAISLKPGMTATVDLRTASRSVLHYLAKPIVKAFGGAMNER